MQSPRVWNIGLLVVLVIAASTLLASGRAGMYVVIGKVIFEPNETTPQRMQVWGAFVFVEGGTQPGNPISTPQKGWLYFTLPPVATEREIQLVRNEWADFKSLAGTTDGIAFGNLSYLGGFQAGSTDNRVLVTANVGPASYRGFDISIVSDLKNTEPVPYPTNIGLVKLTSTGSHAAIIGQLRALLSYLR